VAQNRSSVLRFFHHTEGEVAFNQSVQRLWRLAGAGIFVNHDTEAVDRCNVVALTKVKAANCHFLTREVVEGQVAFQFCSACKFTVGIAFDHFVQGLQRTNRITLIATYIGDLIIKAERANVLRACSVGVGWEKSRDSVAQMRAPLRTVRPDSSCQLTGS